jgi:hypothetical protein
MTVAAADHRFPCEGAVDVQRSPARFALDQSATIRAAMGLLGMRQVELVVEGETTTLTPVDGTLKHGGSRWHAGVPRPAA